MWTGDMVGVWVVVGNINVAGGSRGLIMVFVVSGEERSDDGNILGR